MQEHDNQLPETEAVGIRPRKICIGKLLLFLFIAAIAGFILYSFYVAFPGPDRQETVVLGQTKLAAGSPAGIRILVRDRTNGKPVAGAEVKLALSSQQFGRTALGTFTTSADGTLGEEIRMPEIAPGEYTLIVTSRSPLGADHIERKTEIFRAVRLLLTTDKPLYQPGQTIHLRALLANGRTQTRAAGGTITFEVSDST